MDWDLSSFFPDPMGEERVNFTKLLKADLESATVRFSASPDLSADNRGAWIQLIVEYEALMSRLSHLSSYAHCLASCDAHSDPIRRIEAEATELEAKLGVLRAELKRGLRSATDAVFEDLLGTEELSGCEHYLRDARKSAKNLMQPELEGLAAELSTDGIISWGRLYDTVTGKLTFEMEFPDGRTERRAIAQRRALMADQDRRIRKAAFEAGNQAWQSVSDVLAAALNHIAGTRLTLNRRRGVDHFLDVALQQAGISKKTLDSMFEAIEAERELPRRALALKAKLLGVDKVAWYDLEAPFAAPKSASKNADAPKESIARPAAKGHLEKAFGHAYPKLAGFFEKAIQKKWVEYQPREGKRPGAYCTHSELVNEPRVYMTFAGTLGDVSTLAHEIGHAWHAELMKTQRPLARQYPMTLAESASTFAELLLNDGMQADPSLSEAEKIQLLGETLNDGCAFLLDIPVRFQFEKAFYEQRQAGELSVRELCDLMRETQRQRFGDALAEGGEDPFYWASKLHFFITEVTFYNFPYTFGFLLSRGLYAMYREQGHEFLGAYEQFLQNTGGDWAHKVAAKTLGQSLEDPAFWAKSIQSLGEPLARMDSILSNR